MFRDAGGKLLKGSGGVGDRGSELSSAKDEIAKALAKKDSPVSLPRCSPTVPANQ